MTINTIREKLAKSSILENGKESIKLARKGIEITPRDRLRDWFFFRWLLAKMLIKRDKADDVEEAKKYLTALQARIEPTQHPRMWADTNVLLALAYERRTTGSRHRNLEKSLKAYNDALGAFSKDAYPDLWGKINYALGNSYALNDYGDRAENVRMAIHHYENALQVFPAGAEHEDIEKALDELRREKAILIAGAPVSKRG